MFFYYTVVVGHDDCVRMGSDITSVIVISLDMRLGRDHHILLDIWREAYKLA